jgi:hypothetical protein
MLQAAILPFGHNDVYRRLAPRLQGRLALERDAQSGGGGY